MKDYVMIKSFSGDNQVSCRKLSIEEYYDGDVVEIDDSNFLLSNKIDRVEIAMYSEVENVSWINYYRDGNLYRSDEIRDGECITENFD